uniref:uncharacterized protein LOC122597012 n=1 Tax=Erigeron canadensis TaxID=72917 RepID=UPI001CB8BC6C|nr:uncharacterized protein LOC122597012 [Erigeron canadensis]
MDFNSEFNFISESSFPSEILVTSVDLLSSLATVLNESYVYAASRKMRERVNDIKYLKMKAYEVTRHKSKNKATIRNHRNRINSIKDVNGIIHEGGALAQIFVDHYKSLLGVFDPMTQRNLAGLFVKTIDSQKVANMIRPVTHDEVKAAIFSTGDDKAPSPDGYTSMFFKSSWDIIGNEISDAIQDFFNLCKIITNRIKDGLDDVVGKNQSTFIPGRKIFDNILLTQEVMRNSHKNVGPPRCVIKVYIQKAYDTVDCYLKGRKGLRQGAHTKCEKLLLVNLCFADDLFLFCHDVASVDLIMDCLNKFKELSGLVLSLSMSTTFFYNVADYIKGSILGIMPFEDCEILVEKMDKRISDWRNKSLSFVGRLHLIKYALSSMHIYWSSVFILPGRIVKELEKRMRSFLWCKGPMVKGKAKVAWKDICLPKYEGGLAIHKISEVNKSLMATHIWSIVTKFDSIWVDWVYAYKIKD